MVETGEKILDNKDMGKVKKATGKNRRGEQNVDDVPEKVILVEGCQFSGQFFGLSCRSDRMAKKVHVRTSPSI